MKNPSQNNEFFQYYNERAPEYEDAYNGKFFKKVPDPTVYQDDTKAIQTLLPDYVKGKCLDIACGTGYWLTVYEKNCIQITLIDQSSGMLAECTKKIHALGIEKKTRVIQDDLFCYRYKKYHYDSAVIGFLISHYQENELAHIFNILKTTLKPAGNFIIIDDTFGEDIIARGRSKTGMIKRYLKDGREFEIYKRYFSKADLTTLAQNYGCKLDIIYWGKVFFLAAGRFNSHQA